MEDQSNMQFQPPGRRPRRSTWALKKIVLTVIFAALLFGAGWVSGNRDLFIHKQAAAASGLNFASVNQIYKILKQDFDGNLNSTSLINGAKGGLVSATGDPYTEYFNPTQAKQFNQELSGTITGIGAELGTDSDNNIVVVSPLDGYPAQKAGLKPNDIIAGINGKSTAGISIDTAVSKIRGQEGTKVTLTIVRNGGNAFNVTITREKITVPSVTWKEDGDIGYMKISQFTNDTSDLAQKAAQEFKAKGVKGVVLDLRGNPGGYLTAAVNVSSLWLNQGQTVVSERRGSTITSTEYATGNDILKGLPTAVLIDGGSASASEITSGALHDNGDATLVGAKSFGKGSVQQVVNLPDGSEMKVTIAHWYTPAGKNIDKQGITPDVPVSISDSDVKAGKDPQKGKAYQIVQSKIGT
ncbi:MAG TPA: S41 family peptidase [Candidatus Saccharimonadales bacterium]|nr:S41 family peptidase [Candidatus Saccharimonadales bacterium]